MKGLRGLAGTPGPGPEAFMRPRRALCGREPLGEAGPRQSVRRGRILGRSPIKETASPPGRPGSRPAVPHPRGLLVFRVWGLLRGPVWTVFCSHPCGPVCETLPRLRGPGGGETLTASPSGEAPASRGFVPEDTRFSFVFQTAEQSQKAGGVGVGGLRKLVSAPPPRRLPDPLVCDTDKRPDSQSTRAFNHRR